MDTAALPHYLDTTVLLHYAENGQDESSLVCAYMKCTLLSKITSTGPCQDYQRTYRIIGELTTEFLREIRDDAKLNQSQELAEEEILDRFYAYSRRNLVRTPGSSRRKIKSLVDYYVSEIVEKHKNGIGLSQAAQNSIQEVDDFIKRMQGRLTHLCQNNRYITCYPVRYAHRQAVLDAPHFKQLFHEIDDRRSANVLAEAYHIRREYFALNDLCFVTRGKHILNHHNKIEKDLAGIHPAKPEKIFELHEDLMRDFASN